MNSGSFELKTFRRNIGQNWYHIVLTPRARFPVFQYRDQRELALAAFDWVCERHKIEVHTKEVMEDHVHLFVSCPPDHSIRRLISILKGGSSYYIRKHRPQLQKYPSLWGRGAMYRSVGAVSAEIIERYIEKNVWGDRFQKKLI